MAKHARKISDISQTSCDVYHQKLISNEICNDLLIDSTSYIIFTQCIYQIYPFHNLILCLAKIFSIEDVWIAAMHYNDFIMRAMASQITSLRIVYRFFRHRSKKLQSSASLAFVRGIHRWLVNSPHKGPVTRKMFPLDDVIMKLPPPTTPYYEAL